MPIPLRLRRRRDGTLALIDAEARASGDALAFPEEHLFTYRWMAQEPGVATREGDALRVRLVNAEATYHVREVTRDGVVGELVDSRTHEAPPVDEEQAREIAVWAREARIGELARQLKVDTSTAEQYLILMGQISPLEDVTGGEPRQGEV